MLFGHQMDPNPKLVNAVEYKCILGAICLWILFKFICHVGEMKRRLQMMNDVVAIVEGEHVEGRLDEVDGEAVVVRRVGRVDELVLPKVARHQRHGAEHGRKAERDPKRSGVVGVEGVEGVKVGRDPRMA